MFSTLLWAVSLLFLTNLSARFFAPAADNICTTVANRIETDLIRSLAQQLKRNGKSEEARKVIEQLGPTGNVR